MIDPVVPLPPVPVGLEAAAAIAGLALVLALFGCRLAESAARRVGFGAVLSVTALAAAGWIALFGLGAIAAPGAETGALLLPLALVALSSLFLVLVFVAEGRLADEQRASGPALTDWQGPRG